MKKPQPKEFTSEERRLVLAILFFSRLLLESCTNRNLYASYEQLNDLLHARDLDVLESCLRLLLRPAQRHSAQRSAKSIFTVSQDRLLALAHSWGSKEYGLDLQQLADHKTEIPERLKTLNFQFYRTVSLVKPTAADAATAAAAAASTSSGSSSAQSEPSSTTPTAPSSHATASSGKQRRSSSSGAPSSINVSAVSPTSEGMVVIQVSDPTQLGSSDYEILQHLIQEYMVPEEYQFQLLSRIRIATGISDPRRRQQLLAIRILAIAVMSHVLSEAVVVEKFFAFEPEIIQSLSDLIHPDHNVSFDLQTVALFALDGLAHLKNKHPDVLTAINASASHGVLLYALRKIVAGLGSEDAPYPQDFLDAMFALISFIISSATGGNMVISAGIVPVFLQLLSNKRPAHLRNVTKSISILDSLIYGFSTAFTSFCASNGLNNLVARIKDEVDYSLNLVKEAEASQMTGVASTSASSDRNISKEEEPLPIPFGRTALLKAMFKFVIHMMQSPGTQEGLRNLIDTSLPSTLRVIMENPIALGTSIYAHAINTMTSFIHNEPTSLAILQEAKIPQTLLASLSRDIPASNDVAMNLPGAFGAICLNPTGLEMFTKEFPMKKFFGIFTSIPHVQAFQDNDIASNLGVSMDELVRHQPSLKANVMVELVAMLNEALQMCESDEVIGDDIVFSTLQKTRAKDAPQLGVTVEDEANKDDRKDSLVAQLIEASARFCESFFQNSSSAKDFLKADGINILMKFYTLPTQPYDLANTPAFFTLSHLVRLLSETDPGTAISAVLKEVNRLLEGVQFLLESTNPGSDLLQYIDISNSNLEDVVRGNEILRSLISLHALSGLISDMFCTPAFSHSRNSASVLTAFVNAQGAPALAGLGQLHRFCVWETTVLKRALQKNWNDPSPKSKKHYSPPQVPGTLDEFVEEAEGEDKEMAPATPTIDAYTPSAINTKYFKFVLTQIPHYLSPMYQGITKMLFNRRDIEATQRAHSFQVADSLSKVLQAHISWKRLDTNVSTSDKHAYLSTMIKLLPYVFLDDRNPATLQTITVVSFVRTGGMESLFMWLDSFWIEASSIQNSSATITEEQRVLLDQLYGSIEVILSVLQILTSSKLLLESSHTSPLTSKDDKTRKEDFFEPHEFLVDVRLVVLPHIRSLWLDKQLDRAPAAASRYVIQIITNILKAAGELKPPVSTASPVIVGTATPNIFGARPLAPDATSVATLLDMGFPRSAAELALTRCGNQLDRATEYLLTHQEVVAAAIYEQEREEAAARAVAVAAANAPSTSETPAEPSTGPVTDAGNNQNGDASRSILTEHTEPAPEAEGTADDDEDNDEDDEGDEEDEDEEEMLRQALALSQALDASLSEDPSGDGPHTQESIAGELSSTSGELAISLNQDDPVDIEGEDAKGDVEMSTNDEEAKNEQEYKTALALHEAHKEELSKGREELRPLLIPRSLELIEAIEDVIFNVRDLLVLLCKDKNSNALDELVKDLEKASNIQVDQVGLAGKAFGARLRLLALLFGDVTIQAKMGEYSTTLAPLLMTILTKHVESQAPQKDNNWLSPLLLMVENFLSLADEPRVVPDLTTTEGKEKAAQEDKEMKDDIITPAEKERLLHQSIVLLNQQDLVKDIALSVFRILVRLTRHHSLAMEFLNKGGLELVFSTLKPERIGVQGQQSLVIMIMRHIVEDAVVLQATMEREIVRWFAQPSRARTSDIQSYLRHNSFLGLRELDAFIAGTLNVCKVSKYDSAFRTLQLTLAKPAALSKLENDKDQDDTSGDDGADDKGKAKDGDQDAGEGSSLSEQRASTVQSTRDISEAAKKYSSQISETVIHFLVFELLSTRLVPVSGVHSSTSASPGHMPMVSASAPSMVAQTTTTDNDARTPDEASNDANFVHRCFVLQCLNELLISYPSCKVDMMNFSRRKSGKESINVASKPRANWLGYLLNDLIPYRGTVAQSSETELQKHSIESNFASAVLVAMFANSDEEEEKQPFSHVVQARRFVIDGMIRSFKDAIASTDPVEIKYGKFLSLSELSYKILGASSSSVIGVKANDDHSINIVKVMLEKNFIVILTNVLADIDLNYPHAKILVNAVLKPLEHLTKLSLKMSRAAEPGASRAARQSTPLSGAGSGNASGDEADTPDLYRNSSLGMFDGVSMETDGDDESDDSTGEDDIYEGDEYEEETASDASDLSEEDFSDDDDVDEALEEAVDRNPFHHHSHEISDDEVDQDDEDMDGEEDDDLDEDMEAELHEALAQDEAEDEEMMEWDTDSRPVILQEGGIGNVIIDTEDEPQVADPEYYEEQDRAHRHHTHTHNPHLHPADEGGIEDEDEEDEEDEDVDEDDEDDEDDLDEEGDDIVLLDDAEGFDPVRGLGHGGAWDMTSAFVINDQDGLLNGAQIIDLRGRRPRTAARRLDDRGFFWNDGDADQGRLSYIEDDDFPSLGAPARNPFLQVSDDVITHPLLAQPRSTTANTASNGHRRGGSRGAGLTDWQAFGEFLNGNPSQILGTLMNGGAIRASHGAFRVEVNHGNTAIVTPIDRSIPAVDPATGAISAGSTADAASANKTTMFSTVRDFVPYSTSQRWSQECRMMYGATAQDKASRLANHVINALIPAAEEEHRLKTRELERRRKAEAARKQIAEEKRKAEEEEERIKAEEAEKARLAEEARRAEEAATRATQGEIEGAPMASEESAMDVEGAASATAEPEAEAESAPPTRRMVMIEGEMVDITDSDIDPEFLEALPEEMRREVYNDYLQSQRPAPPATQQSTSTSGTQAINTDFLDVLPGNMRAELEDIMRGQGASGAARSEPLVSAFNEYTLSRLVPQLRQMYRDGGSRSPVPPALLAETSALLDQIPRHFPGLREARDILAGAASGPSGTSSSKKAIAPRDAIQLVDKSSLATLVRLMFLPQPPSRNILNKLLVNLCENSKTRSELLSLLLSILQDGGADLAAVDKGFAQMSLRGKTVVKAHPHHKGKEATAAALPTPVPAAMDNVPNLVARRCLEALYYIVSFNSQAVLFFLMEHENVTLRRSSSKKGKGKERLVSEKYPIVLLLDLLERPIFVESSALMEQLMTLLSVICRPLATLAKDEEDRKKREKEAESKRKEEEATTSTATVSTAGQNTVAPSAESSAAVHTDDPRTAENAGENFSSTTTTLTGASGVLAIESNTEIKEADTEPSALKPPVIPDHCMQLIVRVLTAGECSSKTFQFTLSVIQNLSVLEGARDVITAELVRVARELGGSIFGDLETLSRTLANAMSGVDVQGVALEKFSPASSKQAKLLRVLKTIDYMYSRKQSLTQAPATTQVNIELAPTLDPEEADAVMPRSMRDVGSGALKLNEDEEKVSTIYNSLSFHLLWAEVGNALELIRERSDMIHVATVLLPLIESFMVVCKYVGLRPSTLEMEEAECKATTNSTEELFLLFTEKHSKILNIMVRNNPALMSGSFSLLVHNPKMLEFDNKRNYFTQQLHKRNPTREHYGTLQMNVRREMVFVDSFSQLQSRTGEEIKYSKLNVHFHGEEGVDAGGVTREWFQVLARQMFNPDYALFKTSAADKLTYQPNRASWVNSDHLLFFKFIGRVIGKAIYDGRLLDAYFTRSFYKHILGRPVDYRDVEAVDPEYYKSLVWMLENDITDIVEETFSMETDDFGNKKIVDLKPNGRNIPVTEENKHEYVKYITEQKLTLAIKDQIHSFLQGFHEIIPAHLISIFNEQELELLISGLPDIDVDEWKNNTEYQNYSQASPQIQNFWRAVRSFDQTERAKLLQFVTGTSKVPLGGFSQLQGISGVQKFQIHKDFSSTKRLPSAHTCFNQLDLPEYETYEELRQQLLTAISECSTGFAFA
ncbi:hypothetical protein BC939DRAFT_76403 [Gamsiella multidivaricata]|uniref:uncharacterized protein n=1 Tax=Gamsiella multidivaricata TaxID=101098 RepID=UPI002220326E|nr:uncharacterized protein BC939DRAFT_76403 [Gamsiella multidivaricata]KAI7827971.1 hypothetical protein BC939DRAFT_76403 [Gamsiella multidivaricata]